MLNKVKIAVSLSTSDKAPAFWPEKQPIFGPSRKAPFHWNDAKKGSMRLTEKHIECAHVCARLEISGQNTKKMALEMWCNAFQNLQLAQGNYRSTSPS